MIITIEEHFGTEKKGAFLMEDETIKQKIESNKVLEGLLKDIFCGIDRIADALGDINIRQESKNTFQERDIMNDQGRGIVDLPGENLDQPGEIVEEKKSANVIDLCADIVDSINEQSAELRKIAAHASMLNKSQLEMMEQVENCNTSLSVIAAEVGKIASLEAAKQAEGVTIGTGKAVKLPHEYEQEQNKQNKQNEQGDTTDQEKS